MASLKEIKGRIASVNSTRKITSAMKMVASSKLHHAQVAIQNMLPYETMLEHILKSFLAAEAEAQSIYDKERPVKRAAVVVFSSNSSLCGGFNANIIKLMQKVVAAYREKDIDVEVYPIGRKVYEKAGKLGYNVRGEYSALADKPNVTECIDIAMELGRRFSVGEIDKVELIYHHFKSAGSQVLTRKTFLPIDIEEELQRDHERDLTSIVTSKEAQEYLKKRGGRRQESGDGENVKPLNDNFIVEPDMDTVLSKLIPKLLHLMFYTALLDSNASEHAARMVAMQTATDNADELLRQLNLQYNKSRQQAITNELLDIVGGSVNN
ncbi:MAG: F0F1 ATP synthase subunit gamma [Prevotella sp.]|nr:F0F1 ATP synthase subunit gamma [Prevotella sp.]